MPAIIFVFSRVGRNLASETCLATILPSCPALWCYCQLYCGFSWNSTTQRSVPPHWWDCSSHFAGCNETHLHFCCKQLTEAPLAAGLYGSSALWQDSFIKHVVRFLHAVQTFFVCVSLTQLKSPLPRNNSNRQNLWNQRILTLKLKKTCLLLNENHKHAMVFPLTFLRGVNGYSWVQ